MKQNSVKQSELSSSKMGHEIFFIIYILRAFDISVGIILMECYWTEAIICETRNYFNVGHPIVCYVYNHMLGLSDTAICWSNHFVIISVAFLMTM